MHVSVDESGFRRGRLVIFATVRSSLRRFQAKVPFIQAVQISQTSSGIAGSLKRHYPIKAMRRILLGLGIWLVA